jgi:hypothetical protein
LFVAVAVEVVSPEIVKFEVAPHDAKGTEGAPVVEPLALQFEPLANVRVLVFPTNEIVDATPRLTTPVDETVTTVLVPPVVVTKLDVLPPNVRVPEISPVFPVPENAIEAACVALFKFNVLPLSITKLFAPPESVNARAVVVDD